MVEADQDAWQSALQHAGDARQTHSTASWHTVLHHGTQYCITAHSTASRHTVLLYCIYIQCIALTRTSTALWQTQYYAIGICNANRDTDHCVGGEPPLGGVVYLDGQVRLEHKR